MRSFIIHMKGDAKRAPNARRLLEILPGAEIVDAVRGADVVAAGEVKTRPGDLHAPRYPFALSGGEVGCFLSHRACWQKIVDEGLSHALIVEDDLAPASPEWEAALALAEAYAGPEHYIRLPAKAREKPVQVMAEQAGAMLFLPRVVGLQTVAQVVGRAAAARLLAKSEVIDRPVDSFLQMHWVTGQPLQAVLPSGVRELTEELGGSTIQKRAAGSKAIREIRRAVYRARIRTRPQG
ncbi:glycosyltransferase family 25 protein [Lutimaribacter marinistellae]|uniref:Glycosyltransferase family 25 protein n=1 Tax=Lutimaribacter marinistellae TaxID=1820329 RepID=A0ABV7TC19_9RHOB